MNKSLILVIGLIVLVQFSCLKSESLTEINVPQTLDTGISPTVPLVEGAIVSFSYDDGSDSWYSIGYPLFSTYGYKATFNVTASWVQNRSDWVTELFNNGFEFASHSYEHELGVTESNVENMKLLLDEMGITISGFVGPGQQATPAWGHDEVNIVKKYHTYYSQGYTTTGMTMPYDVFYLQRYGLTNKSNASDITEALEYAANNKTWIIFSGHPFGGTWGDGGYAQSPELLEFVFSEIERLGIQVKTVGEVVNRCHPLGGVIDCSSDEQQEPDLTYFEEDDAQSMDPAAWNEYWHNSSGTGPRFVGSPVVYCHTSNKDLPVMKFSRPVPNGQYLVKAELIPYNTGSTYRVYYSFDESEPSQHSVDISEKTDADLGMVTVTNGEFNLFTQKADIVSGADGFVGWAFIKLFVEN